MGIGHSAGAAVLFCLPLLVGLVFLWSLSLQPTLNWMRARGWQPVEAMIETAEVKSTGRRNRRHHVEVLFRYQYDGAAHTARAIPPQGRLA